MPHTSTFKSVVMAIRKKSAEESKVPSGWFVQHVQHRPHQVLHPNDFPSIFPCLGNWPDYEKEIALLFGAGSPPTHLEEPQRCQSHFFATGLPTCSFHAGLPNL